MTRGTKTALIPNIASLPHSPEKKQANESSGVALEVIDGPMDGARLAGEYNQIHCGRGPQNDLALYGDLSVSGQHTVLSRSDQAFVWTLCDKNSSNGTWLAGERLVSAHPIQLDSTFMLGNCVLHFTPSNEDTVFIPEAETLSRERDRLRALLTPAAAQGYGAALTIAVQEKRAYLSDRHLFLGLAMTGSQMPIFANGQGVISIDLLRGKIWRNEFWLGAETWIEQQLKSNLGIDVFFAEHVHWTPRLMRILQTAETEAEARGRGEIVPEDLLRSLFSDTGCRPYKMLSRQGIRPEQLLGQLTAPPPRPAAPRRPSPTSVSPPNVRALGHRDPTIAVGARETARKLYGLTALYQLAEPEERRQAMTQLIGQELGQLPPGKRKIMLEELRHLFPLGAGSTIEAEEVQRLHRQIKGMEKRLEEIEGQSRTLGGGISWEMVVNPGTEKQIAALSPLDRPRVELLREIYHVTLELESFIVAMVQDPKKRTGSGILRLPGHRVTLRGHVQDLLAGRQVEIDQLRNYFKDMGFWLVATVSAYHEAPEIWFKEFWGKINPVAIETRGGGWSKKLGFQALELWSFYKETVRHIKPDVVSDKIHRVVRERSETAYNRWKKGEADNEKSKVPAGLS